MTQWEIQMRVRVDESEVEQVKQGLTDCVVAFGVVPRYLTAVSWLVDATEQLKRLPAPLPVNRIPESEHRGTVNRRRLGAGPTG